MAVTRDSKLAQIQQGRSPVTLKRLLGEPTAKSATVMSARIVRRMRPSTSREAPAVPYGSGSV